MSAVVRPEFVDLAVIIPLEEELMAVMEVFPSKQNDSTSTSYRHFVDVGNPDIRCLVVQQSAMGKTAASQAATEILRDYEVGILVCLGIAGSLSEDMNLADVCYTGSLMDVYDNSKTGDAPNGGMTLKFSPVHFETPVELTTAFNFARTQPDLRPLYREWQSTRSELAQELIPHPIPGRKHKLFTIGTPKTMCGVIVCGSVSSSQAYNDALVKADRKVLAIETESGGLFTAAKSYSIPAITIRAISDYADANKTTLENETAGTIRNFAAGNAATFLKMQLKNPFVLNVIKKRKNQRELSLSIRNEAALTTVPALSQTVGAIEIDVTQHLRELCPDYKLQAAGYKLPIPRARMREGSKAIDTHSRSPAFEIRTVIEKQRLVMLDVPRTYPDQALPWMIAYDLLTTEIEGRQVLPLVISGGRLSPPRSDLSMLSGHNVDELAHRPGVVAVIIVDDCPVSSKTKMKFLLTEVERYPTAHFVFIARGNGASVASSDLAIQFKLELFDICEVSFSELAHFVERNFQLSGSEAEVIAYRLQKTFKRYELSAHPSYLATISNTTLAALMNANRRSELIQLAVDGSLSFVVADDTNDIQLSRTTRSRFLQKLVRAIRVDGKSFNQTELIQFAYEFATEYDFAVSVVEFIAAFIERGILHFEGLAVKVSLHYIESYLLARELLTEPSAAIRYFNVSSPDFDFATFDIYAELGPAATIVKMIEGEVERSMAALPSVDDRDIATLDLRGTAGDGAAAAKLKSLYSQLQAALNDVIAGKPASDRKQQILDMRDDVRSSAADEAREISASTPDRQDADIQTLNSSMVCWSAGLILINSAAEHLRGKTKQDLASKLIVLASRILGVWTEMHRKVDFIAIRRVLTSDDHILRFCEEHDLTTKDHVRTTIKSLMGNVVDLVEESFITLPLLTVLGGMCYAHQRVLGRSLIQVQPTDIVERLIHSMWLLETDPPSGQAPACALVRELPRTAVLRSAVCSHLITTAFWNHSSGKERANIVAVANAAIHPFAEKIDPKLLTTES